MKIATLLLLVGTSLFSTGSAQQRPPARSSEELCIDDLPNLSVSNIYLNDNNFKKFKKDNRLFILGISDSECDTCCISEPLLKAAQEEFEAGSFQFHTKKKTSSKIKIARVDLSKKPEFLIKEELRAPALPVIYVYYEGQYFSYEGSFQQPQMLFHFINKLLHPLVILKTEEDIQNFFEVDLEYEETTKFVGNQGPILRLGDTYHDEKYKTRGILFLSNKGDYDEEIKGIKTAARMAANRFNLRLAIFSEGKIVKKLKQTTSWFGQGSMNALVLRRYDGEYHNLDLLQVDVIQNSLPWIQKKSIKEVEELDQQTFTQLTYIGQPIAVCFVDFDAMKKNSQVNYLTKRERKKALDESKNMVNTVLPNLGRALYRGMTFAYVDVNSGKFKDARTQFGIEHNKIPALAVTKHGRNIVYPASEPLEEESLKAFLTKIAIGEDPLEAEGGDIINPELRKSVEKVIGEPLTAETFESEALSEGTDAVVLIISSARKDDFQEEFVKAFIECKNKFKRQRTRSVRFYVVDSNTDYSIRGLSGQVRAPSFIVFPAHHKTASGYEYFDKPEPIPMAKFIKKHADINFELKSMYFEEKKPEQSEFGNIEMDEAGNMKPNPEMIAQMQAKQANSAKEKEDYIKQIEDQMRRRGEL